MLTVLPVVVVLLASACSPEATPEDQLQGSWATAPDSQGCIDAATFKGPQIELDTICELTTGAVGLDAAIGPYTVSGDVVSIAIAQATCPTALADASLSLRYSFANGNLRLIGSNGGAVLSRLPPSTAQGAAVTFGCWDSAEQNFTPGPLAAPM